MFISDCDYCIDDDDAEDMGYVLVDPKIVITNSKLYNLSCNHCWKRGRGRGSGEE